MLIRIVNLTKKVKRRGIILFFILFFLPNIYSQINSEIGYTVSYSPLKITNTIIDLYNKGENLGVDEAVLKPIKQLHFLSGFNIGLSYRFRGLKLGGYWNSLSATRTGSRGNVRNDIGNEKNLYLNINSVSLGAELMVKYIGIGTSFGYNTSSLKTKLKNSSSKVLLSENTKYTYYSNKLYLIFYGRATDRFGVSLKPYVSFPWKRIDVSEVENYLGLRKENEPVNTFEPEKILEFGLTFSILNGFQPEY